MTAPTFRLSLSLSVFSSLVVAAWAVGCSEGADGFGVDSSLGGYGNGTGGAASGSGGSSSGGNVGLGSGGFTTGSGGASSGGAFGSGGSSSGGGGSVDDPPRFQTGCAGHSTRFWDCCKPHCGWEANVPGTPMNSCDRSDNVIGDRNAQSACDGGPAHTCHELAPWAVSDTLAYGYAATNAGGDYCGRCYQIQFTGSSHNGGDDAGSRALSNKIMIVQSINIGHDVGLEQFDLLIPGGGVGNFNACGSQWGVSNEELGAQYGGFLSACQQRGGDVKGCVRQRCQSVFGSRGLTELKAGCDWFVDWFQAADNPNFIYREVACPAALSQHSGLSRNSGNISQACGG